MLSNNGPYDGLAGGVSTSTHQSQCGVNPEHPDGPAKIHPSARLFRTIYAKISRTVRFRKVTGVTLEASAPSPMLIAKPFMLGSSVICRFSKSIADAAFALEPSEILNT